MRLNNHAHKKIVDRIGFTPSSKDLKVMRRKVLSNQFLPVDGLKGYTRKMSTILGVMTYKGHRLAFVYHKFANKFITFMHPPEAKERTPYPHQGYMEELDFIQRKHLTIFLSLLCSVNA